MAPLTESQIMISLCVLSYTDETPLPGESVPQQQGRMYADIDSALRTALPGWEVAWGPGLSADRANMMYIAGNRGSNEYAVVIRGTDWSFVLDWLEDFTSVLQIAAPYNGSVSIAAGTWAGITTINGLIAPNNATGAPQTAMQFLRALPPGAQIYTTGHSLGGCLASAYAPWLVSEGIGNGSMKVMTFAGPSAGNQAFASYFNQMFGSRAIRYYNTLDLVPNAWATLPAIEQLYLPWPACPAYVTDVIEWALPYIPAYVQPGSIASGTAVPLPGTIHFGSLATLDDPISDVIWAYEVAQQHASTYYAQLLGAPQLSAVASKVAGIVAVQPNTTAQPRIPVRQFAR